MRWDEILRSLDLDLDLVLLVEQILAGQIDRYAT